MVIDMAWRKQTTKRPRRSRRHSIEWDENIRGDIYWLEPSGSHLVVPFHLGADLNTHEGYAEGWLSDHRLPINGEMKSIPWSSGDYALNSFMDKTGNIRVHSENNRAIVFDLVVSKTHPTPSQIKEMRRLERQFQEIGIAIYSDPAQTDPWYFESVTEAVKKIRSIRAGGLE